MSRALLSALIGFGLLAGCKTKVETPPPAPDAAAPKLTWEEMYEAWEYPAPLPNFEIIDQTGKTVTLNQLGGDAYLLVGFVFTRCAVPEACPKIMTKMRETQVLWSELEKKGETKGKKLHFLSLTIDPEYDQPQIFAKYGEKFGVEPSNWTLGTGPKKLLEDALPSLFNVLAMPNQGTIRHSVKISLLKPGLHDLKEWRNNKLEPQDVVDAIMADGASPKEQGAAG